MTTPAKAAVTASYADIAAPNLTFGKALEPTLDEVFDATVRLPLSMFNRHGLVAGATGTGKTKTLQVMAEGLSDAGVPVLLADLKGDLSGLSAPGDRTKAAKRVGELGLPWVAKGYPVRFLSLDGGHGESLRVPLYSFGPLLLAKVMDATAVQESVLRVVFHIADLRQWKVATLDHLRDLLVYLTSAEGQAEAQRYGGAATGTLNVLLRNITAMEADGMAQFFGEPPFAVESLRATEAGRGVINIVDLTAVQHRPRVFSAFLMWLLSSLYQASPEVGDRDRPELVFFFDEAHMLFEGASKELVETVRQTVRMIRSKGIGVFFVTQQPTDVPESILSQLGCRVQHALRAFTPKDQAALRATAQTFPVSDLYDVRVALTSMGTGEALITGLDSGGDLTATVATRLCAPQSQMDPVARPEPAPEPVPAPPRPVVRSTPGPRVVTPLRPALWEREAFGMAVSALLGIGAVLMVLSWLAEIF